MKAMVGRDVGVLVAGVSVRRCVGTNVGGIDGEPVFNSVGIDVGRILGFVVGSSDGFRVGVAVGGMVETMVGRNVGVLVAGVSVGRCVGTNVGGIDGEPVFNSVGIDVGRVLGNVVGPVDVSCVAVSTTTPHSRSSYCCFCGYRCWMLRPKGRSCGVTCRNPATCDFFAI